MTIDPSHTIPVSVTKSFCSLNCPHCGGHYLKHMATVEEIPSYVEKGYRSFLISGGMLPDGSIPFERYKEILEWYKKKYNLLYNFHVGFKKSRTAKELADVVSMDFFGDSKIMKKIYGISLSPYEILEIARFYERVVFHITVGIMGGEISHEEKALEILSNETDSIVLNVFIPTVGTVFEEKEPPILKDVLKVFEKARKLFKRVILGCMQPKGAYRKSLQESLKGIVDDITKPVESKGKFKGCCAFILYRKNSGFPGPMSNV
ncbi:radical SAM protein [Thermotoga sp. KOL6]|uniref:radical SAM protein n=1 Tax=Thermotoga sp. KOL6 TaxID=126741 RepID=UPI000C791560|nr:radical SAM protein [Thermotoga sp. KOL6]PLV60396.1 radical SAM protein [Thermotoga sp. KOL6]